MKSTGTDVVRKVFGAYKLEKGDKIINALHFSP